MRINKQSPDIAGGVHIGVDDLDDLDVGVGDQGIMFGYATDETEDGMPLAQWCHETCSMISYRNFGSCYVTWGMLRN